MTWRLWTATIVIAIAAAAGWWAARDVFSPPDPTLGEIVTITPAPMSSPFPSHPARGTDGAIETTLVPPPGAGEDDSDDDDTDDDTDVDHPDVDTGLDEEHDE